MSIYISLNEIIELIKAISWSLKTINESNREMKQKLSALGVSFQDDDFGIVCSMIANSEKNLHQAIPDLQYIVEKLSQYAEYLKKSQQALNEQSNSNLGSNSNIYQNTSSNFNKINGVMAGYPIINGEHSIDDDLENTNPNYSESEPNSPWNNNCQRCVSAYEARRRGFDVESQPLPSGNDTLSIMRHPQGWPTVYEGAELIDCSANSGTGALLNIEEEMTTWEDNSRAIIRVRWMLRYGGGGHVFIAEKSNGQIRFVDPQNGETDARSYFDFAKGSDVFCMRIDNLPFTDKIHQCCSKRTIEMR